MVLVRSAKEEELNPRDLKSKIIGHFREPMPNVVPGGCGRRWAIGFRVTSNERCVPKGVALLEFATLLAKKNFFDGEPSIIPDPATDSENQ